jgi:hypothetical protein
MGGLIAADTLLALRWSVAVSVAAHRLSLCLICGVMRGFRCAAGFETTIWPAPGFAEIELGVFMGPEVGHGKTKDYARVQA